jgi:hypothetical protein
VETITINWHGPFNLEYLDRHEKCCNKGLYAISRVWGSNETLMYIGKTKRDFITRMNEHSKTWLGDVRGKIKIRVGIMSFEDNKKFSLEKLSDAEALLILTHIPKNNYSNTASYNGRRNLAVVNKGRRGLLKIKIDTETDL